MSRDWLDTFPAGFFSDFHFVQTRLFPEMLELGHSAASESYLHERRLRPDIYRALHENAAVALARRYDEIECEVRRHGGHPHVLLRGGLLALTLSSVRESREMPYRAIFRRELAANNRPRSYHLFPEMDGSVPPHYGIILYGPRAQEAGILEVGFPEPEMRAYSCVINLMHEVSSIPSGGGGGGSPPEDLKHEVVRIAENMGLKLKPAASVKDK